MAAAGEKPMAVDNRGYLRAHAGSNPSARPRRLLRRGRAVRGDGPAEHGHVARRGADLARRSGRWQTEELEQRLEKAFKYFYPDAIHAGYRPDVVDFFSALRTYLDVGAGLPGGFADAPHLYRSLKSAIAHLLIERLRLCDKALKRRHSYLDEMIAPGNFIITSNWDVLIERLRTAPSRTAAALWGGRSPRGRTAEAPRLN
jgi:hypothetical protein